MGSRIVQRIQDSVHGLMEFRGLETIVVDVLRTPELQRLRKIRQLGLVNYVFPGAEHSRFSHSLGAAHLALRFGGQLRDDARRIFARELVPDEHALADLALAALCHDLGHGPLSHVWEREIVGGGFDRLAWAHSLGLDPSTTIVRQGQWHEIVGQGLLGWPDGQLHRLLELHEEQTSARIQGMLNGQYYYPYLPRILGSDVDVDRADFIMRDTHNTGVAYGRFDLNWLISTCILGRTVDTGKWVVGFDAKKAVRVIEQFLIARQAMYDTVYHHKTVRCIEGMVALLLRRLKALVGAGAVPPVSTFLAPTLRVLEGKALGPAEVLKLDDFALFVLIDAVAEGSFRDDTAKDLARRLQARDPFKQVPVPSEEIVRFLASPDNSAKLHEVVKRFVPGLAQYYVLIDHTQFEMLSREAAHQVLLVNSSRVATRGAEHDTLSPYLGPARTAYRLFTVGPAVESVKRLIESPSSH
jgi:uncharacterized protein